MHCRNTGIWQQAERSRFFERRETGERPICPSFSNPGAAGTGPPFSREAACGIEIRSGNRGRSTCARQSTVSGSRAQRPEVAGPKLGLLSPATRNLFPGWPPMNTHSMNLCRDGFRWWHTIQWNQTPAIYRNRGGRPISSESRRQANSGTRHCGAAQELRIF